MIDTIKIVLDVNSQKFKSLMGKVDIYSEQHNQFGTKYYGWLIGSTGKDLHCTLYPTKNKIQIENSLAAFLYGNNVQTVTFEDYPKAIQAIEEEIRLKLDEGYISRLDLTKDFNTAYPHKVYSPLLTACRHYHRSADKAGGINWNERSRLKALTFYDKSAEQRQQGNELQDQISRFEFKLLQQPHKTLKSNRLTISDLKSPYIWTILPDRLKYEWDSITKIEIMKSLPKKKLTAKDWFQWFSATMMNGKANEALTAIDQLKSLGLFTTSKEATRAKDLIKKAARAVKPEYNSLIGELNQQWEQKPPVQQTKSIQIAPEDVLMNDLFIFGIAGKFEA